MTILIIDRYLLREILPQFAVTFIIFCNIFVISQLIRLSEVLVAFGLSAENVFLPFIYLLVPFLPMITPIAAFFAFIICISRLSNDNEYVAMLASGLSLWRIMRPLLAFAVVLSALAASCGMYLESWGRRELIDFFYMKSQTRIDQILRSKLKPGVFLNDFLGYVLHAQEVSEDKRILTDVFLAPQRLTEERGFVVRAPRGSIIGSVAEGDFQLVLEDGLQVSLPARAGGEFSTTRFAEAKIDLLQIFQEEIFSDDDTKHDYRSLSPPQLKDHIAGLKQRSIEQPNDEAVLGELRKAEFLWWQRIATPFATLGLCLFGMVIGVQDPRSKRGSVFGYSLLIILFQYGLFVYGRKFAVSGVVPAFWGALGPVLLVTLCGSLVMARKVLLPPSERLWFNRRRVLGQPNQSTHTKS